MNLLQQLGSSRAACSLLLPLLLTELPTTTKAMLYRLLGAQCWQANGDKRIRCSMQLFETGSACEVGSDMLAGAETVALAADRRQVLLHIDTVNAALGLLINLAEGSSTHRQSLQTLQIVAQRVGSSQGTTAAGLLARLMQVGQSHDLPVSCLIEDQAFFCRQLLSSDLDVSATVALGILLLEKSSGMHHSMQATANPAVSLLQDRL